LRGEGESLRREEPLRRQALILRRGPERSALGAAMLSSRRAEGPRSWWCGVSPSRIVDPRS
jgi:hypothetical protein